VRGCWFNNDKEIEVALSECMQMQEPNIYASGCFKLVPGKVQMLHCVLRLKIKLINIIIGYNPISYGYLMFNATYFDLSGHHRALQINTMRKGNCER
jgi:hypothetical protein